MMESTLMNIQLVLFGALISFFFFFFFFFVVVFLRFVYLRLFIYFFHV